MRNVKIEHAVDFSELCQFAEKECGVGYNAAHDILAKDCWPEPDDGALGRDVYLSELKQYPQLFKSGAVPILTKFMEMNGVKFITVLAE